uniref:Mothers against decapentaplegic homolog n=1 Tax=Phallusia mammillata TaxID=59560 RepID=A0A6F9DSE9_9ASCI|nr:Smad6/7 protein [Phallusia mammillata]
MLTIFRKRQLKHKLKSRIVTKEDDQTTTTVHNLLANFEQQQLDNLNLALDSRDGSCIPCIDLPTKLGGKGTVDLAMAICKAYRWSELQNTSSVKKMPFCKSSNTICLNPFHYTLFIDIPFTSLDLFNFPNEACQGDESMCSETETGSMCFQEEIIPSPRSPYPVMTRSRSKHWCSLAYWERRNRVSRLFPVNHFYVNIFDRLPKGEGFCLSAVSQTNSESNKVRKCIGTGITLALDETNDDVWLYNRSEYAVFIHSPILEPLDTRTPLVHKLHPDHCAKVYNFEFATRVKRQRASDTRRRGRYDGCSIRISFVKGWGGESYRRQCITTCECWLEVLFNT